mgnify:CR=1 FL=1
MASHSNLWGTMAFGRSRSSIGLSGIVVVGRSVQRRVCNTFLVIGGERKLDQREEVFQYFRVAVHTSLPVFVNSSLQTRIGV